MSFSATALPTSPRFDVTVSLGVGVCA